MNLGINSFLLEDKLVMVTGASSGIGRQCAIKCGQLGASVILLGRDQTRLAESLEMMNDTEKHMICSVDLLDYDKIGVAVKEVVAKKGRIEGLINCAGISTTLPLNSVSPPLMNQFFQANVIGGINLTKQVVKQSHFSNEGGSIIFISSIMGVVGENGKTLYSMTKGALIAAVKSMAVELAPRKIRVNSISPGVVDSPMSKGAIYSKDEQSLSRIRSLHPLGIGQPEDIANLCGFMLSGAARWITGTNIVIDGGYLAK